MERHVATLVACGLPHRVDPFAASGGVDVATGRERANDNAIGTLGDGHAYLVGHLLDLGIVVNEISLTRANENVNQQPGGVTEADGLANHLAAWREPVELKVAAQLHAVGATLNGGSYACDISAANFQFHISET